MKKYSLIILTLVTVIIAMSAMMIFGTSAADANEIYSGNVIYVSDTALTDNKKGDGSSADKPLDPVAVDGFFIDEKDPLLSDGVTVDTTRDKTGHYYLRTALYQAAEKLVNTGGTIVICGPVVLDADDTYGHSKKQKDFYFPESDHPIVITSKYNDVDYSANGKAYLQLADCAHISLGAPTTVENLTIKTYGENRSIAACGNKLVMGEGVECVAMSGTAASNYLNVYGGTRHGETNGGTDVTILSGTYNFVSGGSWGTPVTKYVLDAEGNKIQTTDLDGNLYYEKNSAGVDVPVYRKVDTAFDYIYGDINLKIFGGTFKGQVRVMSVSGYNVLVDGNVNVTLGGDAVYEDKVRVVSKNSNNDKLYEARANSFLSPGCEVYVKVLGGTFSAVNPQIEEEFAFLGRVELGYNLETGDYELPKTYEAKVILDLAASSISGSGNNSANLVYNNVISNWKTYKDKGYDVEVLYPTAWLTKVELAKVTLPSVVVDGVYRPTGAVVNATFSDGTKTYTQTVYFDERNDAFTEEYVLNYKDSGKTLVWFRYGAKPYDSQYIEDAGSTYVKAPEVSLLGARLRTPKKDGTVPTNQALRFVSEYSASGDITVTEKGVLVVKTNMLRNNDELAFGKTYGDIAYNKVESEYTFNGSPRYEVVFDNINQSEFSQYYTARAYVKYSVKGESYIAYSDVAVKNPYEMANKAVANTLVESATNINHLNTNLINVAETFDPTKVYNEAALDGLRRSVVEYMELMANVEWSPKFTFAMYNKTGETDVDSVRHQNSGGSYVQGVGMSAVFIKDQTYYGMPYTSSSTPWMQTSNFESFLPLMTQTYDKLYEFDLVGTNREKGVVANPFPKDLADWNNGDSVHKSYDGMASWLKLNLDEVKEEGQTYSEKEQAYLNYTIVPGSHCSKSVFSAWNLVLNNSATVSRLTATYRIVPGSNSNVIPVGNYVYKGITTQNNTREIIEKNGIVFNEDEKGGIDSINYDSSNTAVMYDAYSKLLPGDALIHYTDSGHTRMVVSVNKTARTVKTIECANWAVPFLKPSNPLSATGESAEKFEVNNSCWKVREYSYDNLLIETYIPARIYELSTGLVDDLSVIVTDTDIADKKLNGTVKSNMQIVSVRVEISGFEGKDFFLTSDAMHLAEYDITKLNIVKAFGLEAGKTYNITLKVGTPGKVTGYTTSEVYPNDVDNDNVIATGYTPTVTTIWKDMPFVA